MLSPFGGTLLLQPSSTVRSAGELTINSEVSIEGRGSPLEISSPVNVGLGGTFVIRNATLTLNAIGTLLVQGKIDLLGVKIWTEVETFVQLSDSLGMINSSLEARSGTLVSMQSFGATVLFSDSTLQGFMIGVSFKPGTTSPQVSNSKLLSLSICERSGVTRITVFSGAYDGLSLLNITDSRIYDFSEVVAKLNFWAY